MYGKPTIHPTCPSASIGAPNSQVNRKQSDSRAVVNIKPIRPKGMLIISMLEKSRLIAVVLYEDRTAINHNGLPSAEPFLHQEQIGLRDLGSFADSANWETVAHALIQAFPL